MNPERRKWWRRPSRIVPLAIVALVVIGLVGFKAASETGLKREMEEVRAKGLPTNPKELDAWYAAVPDEENAALKFVAAHEVYVEPAEGKDPAEVEWREIPHDQRLSTEEVKILGDHVGNNSEALQLIREGTPKKRSRYPADLSDGEELMLPHLWQVKKLSSLTRWEAILNAEQGDRAGAFDGLKSGFAIADTLAEEPLLISELVRMAYLAITLGGMERVVNAVEFNDAQLEELAGIVRKTADDCDRALRRAMIGERAFSNTGKKYSFEEYELVMSIGGAVGAVGGGGGWGTANLTSEWPEFLRKSFYYARRGLGMFDRDRAFYFKDLGRLIDATTLDHPKLLSASEAVAMEIGMELSKHPIALELSNMSLPICFGVPKKEVLLVARLRCARAALEIERWRRKNGGKLPGEEELVPAIFSEMPTDPVDGKPLKYQRLEGQGYRVIAVEASARDREGRVGKNVQEIAFEVVK